MLFHCCCSFTFVGDFPLLLWFLWLCCWHCVEVTLSCIYFLWGLIWCFGSFGWNSSIPASAYPCTLRVRGLFSLQLFCKAGHLTSKFMIQEREGAVAQLREALTPKGTDRFRLKMVRRDTGLSMLLGRTAGPKFDQQDHFPVAILFVVWVYLMWCCVGLLL